VCDPSEVSGAKVGASVVDKSLGARSRPSKGAQPHAVAPVAFYYCCYYYLERHTVHVCVYVRPSLGYLMNGPGNENG
jgi:hypothetical protein